MRIRSRVTEGLDELDTRGACLFCSEHVRHGALWHGRGGVLRICSDCVADGELGKLAGDAARDPQDLARMLDATAREGWRSLALAQERERR